MELASYLSERDLSDTTFAKAVGSDQGSISRARRGERVGLGLALRIEHATSGLVRAEDLPLTRASRKALRGLRSDEHGSAA